MEIEKKEIYFNFKGKRKYIHGTDLINSTLTCFPVEDISDIKLSIHDFIVNPQCELIVYHEQPTELTGKFQGRLTLKDQKKWVELIEINDSQYIPKTIDYNENEVTDRCKIDDNCIILKGMGPFSMIENIVSMKKYLLNSLFPRERGKWIFTQLEMDKSYNFRENLKIEITHNLKDKLIRSNINHNETIIGKLYFSLVMK